MTLYILSGMVVLSLLVCAGCLSAVWKAVRLADYAEKQRHYLEKALKARGLWDDYQHALRDSLEIRGREERANK
ncbi:hypothetical protein [Pseudomonas asiatica]|uniref:hypothetical protein n=1 Tax=Pseudomonas asiatica TaxID=2219225 RepID=UPI0010C0CF6A|nr:hypothetical protein [Pseudomonas asiatica]EKT4528328.1 hypothetical protein [Pseudomonas putida]